MATNFNPYLGRVINTNMVVLAATELIRFRLDRQDKPPQYWAVWARGPWRTANDP